MTWALGRVPIRLRRHQANDPYEYRSGLISEDLVWGLHLDGEYIDLTHMPSGKRLGRFPSLGQAAACAEKLLDWSNVWTLMHPEEHLTDIQLADVARILTTYQTRTDD